MSPNRDQRSRRALLAGAAAGVAAIAAGSLARPLPVRAGTDGDVVLGGDNASASTTTLSKISGDAAVLMAENNYGPAVDANSDKTEAIRAVSDTGVAISAVSKHFIGIVGWGGEPHLGGGSTQGVMGRSGTGDGVIGMSTDGAGVHGSSDAGTGVYAHSRLGWGVTGSSEATQFGAGGGVFGTSDKTVGVFGLSAEGIAVEGRSDHDPATGIGVKGYSGHGIGVNGETEGSLDWEGNRDVVGVLGISRSVDGSGGNGIGVEGRSETGIGVLGGGQVGVHGATGFPGGIGVEAKSETGPALHAIAVDPDHGARAIVAEGPVEFSSAGRGIITLGATRATVVSPVALNAAVSKILVTLLANPAGTKASSLSHVKIHESLQAFTVILTAPAAREVPFAYFVIS